MIYISDEDKNRIKAQEEARMRRQGKLEVVTLILCFGLVISIGAYLTGLI